MTERERRRAIQCQTIAADYARTARGLRAQADTARHDRLINRMLHTYQLHAASYYAEARRMMGLE